MKKILLFLFLAPFLNAMEGQLQESMQEKNLETEHQEPRLLKDLGLPNEIWTNILAYAAIHCNHSILDQSTDIYEAINIIEKDIEYRHINISLVCKTFKDSNISQEQLTQLKKQIRELYIPLLNEKFLEKHEGNEGLYPKDGKWHKRTTINNDIAAFLATGTIPNNTMLDILKTNNSVDAHLKLINLLLFYGANPNLQNMYGQTALNKAAIYHNLINRNNTEIITVLLQYNANPNLQDNNGNTALSSAAFNHHPTDLNNMEIITLFLQHGANPNLQDNNGRTALYWAVIHHHPTNLNNIEITALLLRQGANPNLQENDGRTALSWATLSHHPINKNKIEIIILLLQHNANPYLKDCRGKTAFDIAKEKDFNEFPLLVKKHAQNTLKKICLQYVLTNLSQFEDQIDILPTQLQEQINNLKS